MRDNRRNIFNDGELVETVTMPIEIYKGPLFEKGQWARTVLGEYVSKFHGKRASSNVMGHLTLEGRVTGTQATFFEGGKEIIYMILEPKKQPGPDGKYRIHILKAVYDKTKTATEWEIVKNKLKATSFSCGLFDAARTKR